MNHVVVYRTLQKKHLNLLSACCRVSYFPEITEENEELFLKELNTADGLFGAGMKITEKLLDQAKKLKVISNFSAGYDNLDLDLLTERGIMATNAPDALTDTVADLIFASMLATARRVVELDSFVRKGAWNGSIEEQLFGSDVHHRNIGIVGLGRIGRTLVKRAKGFDMNVYYHKRSPDFEVEETYGAVYCEELDELLVKSDFVCVTLPLTENTKHKLSDREFKIMKSSAILVNGSRGQVIDESALIKALREGEIRGAGLDVFEMEPLDPSSELMTMNNVVLTPHIGSATVETRGLMVEHGIKNLLSALKGERPDNLLNERVFSNIQKVYGP